jgi:hypothetical protein
VSRAACAPVERVGAWHVESQYLLSLIYESLYLECAVSTSEHVEKLAAALALFRLHIELLHAHDKPPCVVDAYASVLDDQALAQNQVVALGELLVEGDGGVRARELTSELELGQGREHERGSVKMRVGELQIVQLGGLLRLGRGSWGVGSWGCLALRRSWAKVVAGRAKWMLCGLAAWRRRHRAWTSLPGSVWTLARSRNELSVLTPGGGEGAEGQRA